ncbi:hypothetical protein [Desulfovibrio cuneatus]|uniref:hypothetical protein n=1 Tax=Desulfovibrio cuneatus TaxID=159728 RepID=UPI0004298DAB|nr:hypothetical protein [Desulfovibrio cuneatus]
MGKIIPSRNQFQNWTLPDKASYIGLVLTILTLIVSSLSLGYGIFHDYWTRHSIQKKITAYNILGFPTCEDITKFNLYPTNLSLKYCKDLPSPTKWEDLPQKQFESLHLPNDLDALDLLPEALWVPLALRGNLQAKSMEGKNSTLKLLSNENILKATDRLIDIVLFDKILFPHSNNQTTSNTKQTASIQNSPSDTKKKISSLNLLEQTELNNINSLKALLGSLSFNCTFTDILENTETQNICIQEKLQEKFTEGTVYKVPYELILQQPNQLLKNLTMELVLLIHGTESITANEKQNWFDILPIMPNGQRINLYNILLTERIKLKQLDEKYINDIRALNEKHNINNKAKSSEQIQTLKMLEEQALILPSDFKYCSTYLADFPEVEKIIAAYEKPIHKYEEYLLSSIAFKKSIRATRAFAAKAYREKIIPENKEIEHLTLLGELSNTLGERDDALLFLEEALRTNGGFTEEKMPALSIFITTLPMESTVAICNQVAPQIFKTPSSFSRKSIDRITSKCLWYSYLTGDALKDEYLSHTPVGKYTLLNSLNLLARKIGMAKLNIKDHYAEFLAQPPLWKPFSNAELVYFDLLQGIMNNSFNGNPLNNLMKIREFREQAYVK